MKKLISLILALTMFVSATSISFIDTVALEASVNSSKISSELMENIGSKSKVYAYVWFKDTLDTSEIKIKAEKELGFTQCDLEKIEKEKCTFKGELYNGKSNTEEYDNFMLATKELRYELLSKQTKLVEKQRELTKNHYAEYNKSIIELLGIAEDKILYTSYFSPVVIIEVSESEVKSLSASKNVEYIGHKEMSEAKEDFASALPAVDAKYVRDTLGYDGYGVKVGVIDSGRVDDSHSELTETNITILNPNKPVSTHSTEVLRVLAGSKGVAPNAQVYATSVTNTFEETLENLLSQGVSVVNMSIRYERPSGNYYTDLEKWIDHIAYQHGVTIVKSAGNKGVTSDVNVPGLAYNVITVGGTNTKYTTSRTDDTLYSVSSVEGSSSANGGTAGCAKPDFLAPAYYQGFEAPGTSFAAPMVTGIIAQMIECRPTIATKPAVIKAVLTSSTTRKMAQGISSDKVESWEDTITAQQGAGEVSARKAIYILSLGNYSIGFISSGSITVHISVTSSDLYIRSSIAWLRNNTVSQHTNGSVSVGSVANFKLKVFKPNGSSCGESNIPTSSVELVHFNVNGTYGTYNVEISKLNSNTDFVEYAFAWR